MHLWSGERITTNAVWLDKKIRNFERNAKQNNNIANNISVVSLAAKMMFWRLKPKHLGTLWISLSIFWRRTLAPTISLGSLQNIGLHTGARANVVTYLLTYFEGFASS